MSITPSRNSGESTTMKYGCNRCALADYGESGCICAGSIVRKPARCRKRYRNHVDPVMPITRFSHPRSSRPGFNLIEVTIVVAVAGILSAVTLPRAAGFLDRIKVRGAVTEIVSLFSTARHTAISRASQIVMEIDPSTASITIRAGPDTLQRREIGLVHDVTLTTNRQSITYSPMGTGYGAANLTMMVTRGSAADTVVVSRLGRVRY